MSRSHPRGKPHLGLLDSRQSFYASVPGHLLTWILDSGDNPEHRNLSLFLAGIIGYVAQESYLFNPTLRSNLQYEWTDATQEQFEAAAGAAFIQQWISELPDAYDTVVGGFETRPPYRGTGQALRFAAPEPGVEEVSHGVTEHV